MNSSRANERFALLALKVGPPLPAQKAGYDPCEWLSGTEKKFQAHVYEGVFYTLSFPLG